MDAPVSLKLYILLDVDGSVVDVSVLTKDARTRLLGFKLIEKLNEEIEVFEGRCKERLSQLGKVQ
jgi:hypothetical protein